MNALSWALYAADALGSVKGLLIALAVLYGPVFMIVTAFQRDDATRSEKWPWPKGAFIAAIVMAFAACMLPSAKTVYLIAASEVGERVANSSDGRDMLALIRNKIKEALAEKT